MKVVSALWEGAYFRHSMTHRVYARVLVTMLLALSLIAFMVKRL